jgi:hypothetical protein
MNPHNYNRHDCHDPEDDSLAKPDRYERLMEEADRRDDERKDRLATQRDEEREAQP